MNTYISETKRILYVLCYCFINIVVYNITAYEVAPNKFMLQGTINEYSYNNKGDQTYCLKYNFQLVKSNEYFNILINYDNNLSTLIGATSELCAWTSVPQTTITNHTQTTYTIMGGYVICKTPFPDPRFIDRPYLLWLAYCSYPYLTNENNKISIVGIKNDNYSIYEYITTISYSNDNYFPTNISYYYPYKVTKKWESRGAKPKVIKSNFENDDNPLAAKYFVKEYYKTNGINIPIKANYNVYIPDNQLKQERAYYLCKTHNIIVTNIINISNDISWLPNIDRKTEVIDKRFFSESKNVPYIVYAITNKNQLVSTNNKRLQNIFKKRIEGNIAARQTKWVYMVIMGLILLLPLLIVKIKHVYAI